MPQQDNDIYKFMKANNLTDKDEKTFLNEYSDPKKAKEVYDFFKANKLTDRDEASFYDTYLKKKEPSQSSGGVSQQNGYDSMLSPFQQGIESIQPPQVSKKPKPKSNQFINIGEEDASSIKRPQQVKLSAVNYDSAVDTALKKRGIDKNNPSYKIEAEKLYKKVREGELVGHKKENGEDVLLRVEGFGESLVNTISRSAHDTKEAFKINSITDPKELAQYFQNNPTEEQESKPSGIGGELGELIGGVVKPGVLLAANAVAPGVGTGIMAAEATYSAMGRQKRELFDRGLLEGLTPEEAAKKAMETAPISAIPEGVMAAALGTNLKGLGNVVNKAADEGFKKALTNSIKSVAKVSAGGGATELASTGIQSAKGYNITPIEALERSWNSATGWAKMDAAFKILGMAGAAPKYLKSAAKEYISTLPKEGVSQFKDQLPLEERVNIDTQLSNYETARKQVEGLVPEESMSTFAGLVEKRNNLEKSKEGKAKSLSEPIQKEIDSIDERLGEMQRTGKVVEVDDITGEQTTAPKKHEELTKQEREGIVVPKEYGNAEVIEKGEGENKTFRPEATYIVKEGGLEKSVKIKIEDEGKAYTSKEAAQKAADEALAKHFYENSMPDYDKPEAKEVKIQQSPKTESTTVEEVNPVEQKTEEFNETQLANRKHVAEGGENYKTDLNRYAPKLYKEVSAEQLEDFLPTSRRSGNMEPNQYFSDSENLALGQGKNKGVLLKFNSDGIEGTVNLDKPGLSYTFPEQEGEYVTKYTQNQTRKLHDNLYEVQIKPDAKMDNVTKSRLKLILGDLEKQGWTKERLEDGTTIYKKPQSISEPIKPTENAIQKRSTEKAIMDEASEDSGKVGEGISESEKSTNVRKKEKQVGSDEGTIIPPTEPPVTEMGKVIEGKPEDLTKIANAVNDEFIEGKFGTEALDKVIGKLEDADFERVYYGIKSRIEKGTLDPKDVRERVLTTKSGNSADQAALLYDLVRLKDREKQIIHAINNAEEGANLDQLRNSLMYVQDEMMDNALANRLIGRDWYHIGMIRQQWAKDDFSLDNMTAQYKASKGVSELTPEQEKEVKAQYNAIRELKIKLDEARKERDKAVQENAKLIIENEELEKLKGKAKKQKQADKSKKSDEAIKKSKEREQKARENLRKLGGNLSAGFNPQIAIELSKIAAEKVYQGIVKLDELVSNVWEEVKDILPAGWTEEDVRNHLFPKSEAQYKKYSADAITLTNKELREKVDTYTKLQKEYAQKIFEWKKDRRIDIMDKKPLKERILDGILRWQRFAVLSYPSTMVKLAAVVGHQALLKPIKFLTQYATGQLTKLVSKDLAKKQNIWGTPTARSLGKYYSEMIRNFSLANLREQFSGIDTKEILYGKGDVYDEWVANKGLLELPGRSHGYIKSFIKNPEFKFAHEQQVTAAIDRMMEADKKLKEGGLSEAQKEKYQEQYDANDITNPDVMERINKLSLEHGKWSILMNDNKFVEKFRQWTNGGGFMSALIKSEIPIVKIPTNYIGRYFLTKYGLIRAIIGKPKWDNKETNNFPGIAELIYKGTKDVTPQQADLLGKALTVGSYGAGFFALGYMLQNKVHREEDGSVKVGETKLSKNLTHAPEIESFLSGTDMGKEKKGDFKWLQNFVSNDIEVAAHNPFMQSLQYGFLSGMAASMLDFAKGKQAGNTDKLSQKITDAVAKKITDMTVPGFVKQPAQWLDTKEKGIHPMSEPIRRKPQGDGMQRAWQTMEMALPFLRQNVPAVNAFSMKDYDNPEFNFFTKKGLDLPNTLLTSEVVTDEEKGTKMKVGDYPKETQEKYQNAHKRLLKEKLKEVLDNGTVYMRTYTDAKGEKHRQLSFNEKENAKEVKIDDLSKEELAQLLHLSQQWATTAAKKEVFTTEED